MKNLCIFVLSILFLASCGGGGERNQSPNPPFPTTPPPSLGNISPLFIQNGIEVYGSQSSNAGETIGFALIDQANTDIDVKWRQLSGPTINILANNSQAIGFTPEQAGSYQIRADVIKNNVSYAIDIDFSVNSQSPALSPVMLDHAASELSKVSLHVHNASNLTIESIEWNQLAGPAINEVTEQGQFLFFDAPEVSRDSLVVYEVTTRFTNGTTSTDDAFVLIKNIDYLRDGLFYSNEFYITDDMHAYKSNSPYKRQLEQCVYNNRIPGTPTCTLNDLPLIGSVNLDPSIDDILDRTLVSHPWMGDRFKQYLESSAAGPDMLRLLRGVTAVVISYDVRPSFYWVATGAIYLDANNFWQTPEERDTLNDQPDYRRDFGNELQFLFLWRYVKNNQFYPANAYPKDDRQTRSFYDLEASISWLMYHELAHANDFFPPTSWASINGNTTPLAYYRSTGANSDVLNQQFPLRSDEMHGLADVRFGGQTPNQAQKDYTASNVRDFFEPDIAPSFYAYYTEREDFATLFERFIMLHRLGASADLGIVEAKSNPNYQITWGQRNRISEQSLKQRTVFTIDRIYPELGDSSALFDALPASQLFPVGSPWFSTFSLQRETRDVNNVEIGPDELQFWLEQSLKVPHKKEVKLPGQ